MIARPSTRVVLIDAADRLLLFSSRNRLDGTVRWYTPGGGLQPGETHQDAALRELYKDEHHRPPLVDSARADRNRRPPATRRATAPADRPSRRRPAPRPGPCRRLTSPGYRLTT
ncbi:NUDIX domain-containing protein [Nonomuraea sp. NPDC049750]|uniref:NUDIX domain-containing protein n=1 Tax=Nonomuraea sp. NPDC049750 TaxID=3154738 RepID=UPI0033E14AE8